MIVPITCLFEAHLTVASLDLSVAFYRDQVGLELAQIVATRKAAFFWAGGRGRTMLGLWEAGAGPEKTTTHIAFAATLDDVIAAPERLRSLGIVPLDFDGRPTDEPVALAWMPAASVYFRDPDGHLLEYIAMLPDAPRPDAGVVSWRDWTRSTATASKPDSPASETDAGRLVRVLGISGSLRTASSNSALVRAASRLAPQHVEVTIFSELAAIPPFNPDLDNDVVPPSVSSFRAALQACDAIVISSPEYAHGVSGVLKNALDWVVSSGEFIDKPVAVINASRHATLADAALRETIRTMNGRVIDEASVTIAVPRAASAAGDPFGDPARSAALTKAVALLARAARTAVIG